MKGFSEHFVGNEELPDLSSAAVLIVDMLNDFCCAGGKMPLKGGSDIVPSIVALSNAARKKGLQVIYVNDNHRSDRYDREFEKREPHCIDGTWGAEVLDELNPQEGDLSIKKRRFSGFFQTDLELILRELDVNTVIVTGVVTNICVRSTCHDAFFLGYNVIVPRDCVCATAPREQESSLWDIETHFGSVTDSQTLIGLIEELDEKSPN